MHVFCKYFPGNVRLTAGLNLYAGEPGSRAFCIDGVVHQVKGSWKITSRTATLVVSHMVPEERVVRMYLMSSDLKYKDSNDKFIDVEVPDRGNVFITLLALLRDRYTNTGNPFELTFSGDKGAVSVAPITDEEGNCILSATFTGVYGEAMTRDEYTINRTVESCMAVKSFCYETHYADSEKSVSVRRGFSEIYREISRYLNKTLCLVSLDKSGTSLVEQFISISSAMEMTTKQDGKRHYRRLQFPFPANDSPFCIYTVSSTVEDIIRDHGNRTRKG